MKERIKELRKKLDLNQTEFAERLGLSQGQETKFERGIAEPTDRTISDICREFNVNEEWLRSGTGEMFRKMTEQDLIKQKIDNQLKDGDEFTKNVLYQIASLTPEEWKAIEEFIYKIKK